ncbi:hypothetical protein [Infirmifilum sp.]|uniref:hypothetical protein n=1 Tax=Infirmifilum sp. TaxID=2856575 RepID=UPI003D0F40A5
MTDDLALIARRIIRGEAPQELESLALAYRELRETFNTKSQSWYYRALYRALAGVKPVRKGEWLVKGFRELGDSRPSYRVWLSNGKYKCECFYTRYGYTRERGICTHIAAVMLWRRQRTLSEFVDRRVMEEDTR